MGSLSAAISCSSCG